MPISLGTTTVTALFLGTTSITSAYLGNTLVFGGSFTPLSLFSTGAQGIWLDPSDLTTMFSDRAGTTAVTTPGTVVGLRLDKSKGLTLGAEKISNGGPFANTTGWSPTNATVAAVSNELVLTTTAGSGFARTSVTGLTAGRTYKIAFTARRISGSGGARISVSGIVDGPTNLGTTDQTLVLAFLASGTTANLDVNSNGGVGDYAFSSISVRELAGNHAVAPTDAARPIYGVEPKGGRRNLLTWSEDFTNAAWTKGSVSIPTTNSLSPTGTATANFIKESASGSANRFVYGGYTAAATGNHTISVYAKANGVRYLHVRDDTVSNAWTWVSFDLQAGTVIGNSGSSYVSAGISDAGSGWYRCFFTFNQASAGSGKNAVFSMNSVATVPITGAATGNTYTGTGNDGILIWGAQLELGSTATNYQRTTTAYDITESGVATCHYVQYDGSDDSLSTSAIDFTATDKMSVFAGVRKLSDAATAIVAEIGVGSSVGSVAVFAPLSGNSFAFRTQGTVSQQANSTSTYAAPTSKVVTCLGDISGDLSSLRLNGALEMSSTGDQGTGPYGNWPVFIGRRNNSTLPFNGRDYGILVVGKAVTPAEITDTETWLAARTSGVSI